MPTLDFRHDPIEKNVISNEPLEITFFSIGSCLKSKGGIDSLMK